MKVNIVEMAPLGENIYEAGARIELLANAEETEEYNDIKKYGNKAEIGKVFFEDRELFLRFKEAFQDVTI